MPEEKTTGETEATDPLEPIPGEIVAMDGPLKGPDIPWNVVEIMEAMPPKEQAIGFIKAQVNTIVVTRGGFYGHFDGKVQRLPMNLIDNE